MSTKSKPNVSHEQLLEAWRRTLPEILDEAGSVEINTDKAKPDVLHIQIVVPGRNEYTLDFTCIYLDSREVQVELIDVDKDNRTVDKHSNDIQSMIDNYVRKIHECAQALHSVTHG